MNLIYGLKYQNNDFSESSSYNLNSANANIGVEYALIDNLLHNMSLSYELLPIIELSGGYNRIADKNQIIIKSFT